MGKIGIGASIRTLFVYFLFFASAFAQGTTGAIRGQVVDQDTAASIQGAIVMVSSPRTGMTRTTTTNAAGRFQLQLAPGTYVLMRQRSPQGRQIRTVDVREGQVKQVRFADKAD